MSLPACDCRCGPPCWMEGEWSAVLPLLPLTSVDVTPLLGPQGHTWEVACGVDVILSSSGAEHGQERRWQGCAGALGLRVTELEVPASE